VTSVAASSAMAAIPGRHSPPSPSTAGATLEKQRRRARIGHPALGRSLSDDGGRTILAEATAQPFVGRRPAAAPCRRRRCCYRPRNTVRVPPQPYDHQRDEDSNGDGPRPPRRRRPRVAYHHPRSGALICRPHSACTSNLFWGGLLSTMYFARCGCALQIGHSHTE